MVAMVNEDMTKAQEDNLIREYFVKNLMTIQREFVSLTKMYIMDNIVILNFIGYCEELNLNYFKRGIITAINYYPFFSRFIIRKQSLIKLIYKIDLLCFLEVAKT